MMKRCLLVIDVQNDFISGSLQVPEAEQIVPVINKIRDKFDLVVFTKDWHPANHCSFKENGGIWPVHCVQNTAGAKLHKDLDVWSSDIIINKGESVDVDSYSAFWDNERKKSTGLAETINGISNKPCIYIAGLATDYCVKFSAIDCIKEGFNTYLLIDACKGVNIKSNDSVNAIIEMKNLGIHIETSLNIERKIL